MDTGKESMIIATDIIEQLLANTLHIIEDYELRKKMPEHTIKSFNMLFGNASK